MPKTIQAPTTIQAPKRVKGSAKTTCSICMEDRYKRRMTKLECGHYFCKSCIKKWAKQQNTCPQCRKRFTRLGSQPVEETNQQMDQGGWDNETIRETTAVMLYWIGNDSFKNIVYEQILLGSAYHIDVLNRIVAGLVCFRDHFPPHIVQIFDIEYRNIQNKCRIIDPNQDLIHV